MKKTWVSIGVLGLSLAGDWAYADSLKVVAGACRREKSGEVIRIWNMDGSLFYGFFARGTSKAGDQISLDGNSWGHVKIRIYSPGSIASYALVPLAADGPTRVRTGIRVPAAGAGEMEWLSCDLEVL